MGRETIPLLVRILRLHCYEKLWKINSYVIDLLGHWVLTVKLGLRAILCKNKKLLVCYCDHNI